MSRAIQGSSGAGGASGWQLTGTRVELTLATNHVSIGTTTPALTGSGDLTVTGNTDLEGVMSVGNGAAVDANVGLTVNYATPVGSDSALVNISGTVNIDDGTSDINVVDITPTGVVFTDSNTHPNCSTVEIDRPNVTIGSATVTQSASLRIVRPPLTGTNNYALLVDAGDSKFDGTILLPSGTAADPALAWSNDKDTGLSNSSNEIIFSSNGTLRAKIRNSGIRLINGSLVDPSYSFLNDTETGLRLRATDELSCVVGTEDALVLIQANDQAYPVWHTTAGITAFATGGQANAVLLGSAINEVSTVATTADSVKLVSAEAGIKMTIINNGANAMDVFPATSDNLGAGVDTAVSLAAGANITYISYDVTNWVVLT